MPCEAPVTITVFLLAILSSSCFPRRTLKASTLCNEAQAPTAEIAVTPPSIRKSAPTTYAENHPAASRRFHLRRTGMLGVRILLKESPSEAISERANGRLVSSLGAAGRAGGSHDERAHE